MDFRKSECKEFSRMGTLQGICFALMALCLPSLIWISFYLFLKIELTLFCIAGVIAIIYHYLDKFYRKLFEDEYKKNTL